MARNFERHRIIVQVLQGLGPRSPAHGGELSLGLCPVGDLAALTHHLRELQQGPHRIWVRRTERLISTSQHPPQRPLGLLPQAPRPQRPGQVASRPQDVQVMGAQGRLEQRESSAKPLHSSTRLRSSQRLGGARRQLHEPHLRHAFILGDTGVRSGRPRRPVEPIARGRSAEEQGLAREALRDERRDAEASLTSLPRGRLHLASRGWS
mmetsp:Transcript_118447/g.377554  ORF Transcript_118447/g.377554 Transcript_118447/m.377554 type:complete len:208 (+) Transcript_118447:388-1011(+)